MVKSLFFVTDKCPCLMIKTLFFVVKQPHDPRRHVSALLQQYHLARAAMSRKQGNKHIIYSYIYICKPQILSLFIVIAGEVAYIYICIYMGIHSQYWVAFIFVGMGQISGGNGHNIDWFWFVVISRSSPAKMTIYHIWWLTPPSKWVINPVKNRVSWVSPAIPRVLEPSICPCRNIPRSPPVNCE